MITESSKSIKNHLKQNEVTRNQEKWIENAKLIGKTASQTLRHYHPKSCLGSHKGTLDLSTALHPQQRSIAQVQAFR